ncbi:MAG: metallohydrolase [Dehalococcoidia bacterium]|nr:MAG: metallohydrolase [Dehalococcoidia bacterium]
MTAKLLFFPVDCGDMTLVEFDSGKKLLVDVNIRAAADDPDDETPDVVEMLKARLPKDEKGRHYVDAFMISHPDEDHCRGFKKHFYTGDPANYPEGSKKILVRELWSSPIAFRRASTNHTLCEDAQALNAEARRRVARFRAVGTSVGNGDRILILGEDQDGKTDDLGSILIKVEETFSRINGGYDGTFTMRLLAPLPKEEEDEETSKNDSSVIMQMALASGGVAAACRFLTGGDAGVEVWEKVWERYETRATWLQYDVLLTPHHCSWHSLSHNSWSECGEDAEVSPTARKALSQARSGAHLIASSKEIIDDDSDPPCIRAKREYVDIADDAGGDFQCVMEEIDAADPQPLEFHVTGSGTSRVEADPKAKSVGPQVFAPSVSSTPREVNKQGGGRYA